MSVKIAHWTSKGARWEAILDRMRRGYRLSERKHGKEVGASVFAPCPNSRRPKCKILFCCTKSHLDLTCR